MIKQIPSKNQCYWYENINTNNEFTDLLEIITYVLLIDTIIRFYVLWNQEPCKRCISPSDLAAKRIADLLADLKRNEAFFKSRCQILVMVTPQDVEPVEPDAHFNEFLVFPVSATRFLLGGLCNQSRNKIYNQHHLDISFCYGRKKEVLTLRFSNNNQIHNVCISPSLAHNKLYFNWTNLRCHVHPNCNPDVPEDLRTVADSFIDALQTMPASSEIKF